MNVNIASYEVHPGKDLVTVELEIGLPSGTKTTLHDIFEHDLEAVAAARSAGTWNEADLVTIVSGVFFKLSQNVTI